MNLLDNVYFYNDESGKWEPSFIISEIRDKKRFIVAKHGPHLPLVKVLPEDEYIRLVDSGMIDRITEQVKGVK